MNDALTIGKAAKATNLPPKTIRYYEEVGLIAPAIRSDNGYRYFTSAAISELKLVKGARDAGFTIEQCRELMNLFRDEHRQRCDVKAITEQKISHIKQRILALTDIVQHLESLNEKCSGGEESECAILDGLIKK